MKIFKPNRGKGFVKGSERVGEITATYMSDDFTGNDGDPPDVTKWEMQGGNFPAGYSGYNRIENDKLEFYIEGTGAWYVNPWIAIQSISNNLEGDFTLEVDWELLSSIFGITEGNNKIELSLSEVDVEDWNGQAFNVHFEISRITSTWDNLYNAFSTIPFSVDYYTTVDTSGKFRLTRIDGTIKAYVWANGQWEWDGNTDGHTYGTHSGPLTFFIKAFGLYQGSVGEGKWAVDNFIGPAIGVESNRAMYVFDKEAQPKVFKSFNKKVRRPKIWR